MLDRCVGKFWLVNDVESGEDKDDDDVDLDDDADDDEEELELLDGKEELELL